MLCPKCNRPVLDNARFCGSCGAAVDQAASNPQPTMIRPSAAAGSAGGGGGGGTSSAAAPAWSGAAAKLPGLLERVKKILLTPKTEWPVIDAEPTTIAQLYTGYVIPLAALAALMSIVRMSLIGISIPFGGVFRTPLVTGLTYALVSFVFGLVGLYLVGLIINGLAPTFGGQRNQRQALKTAAYAFTPAWLGSVFGLLPALAVLLELLAGIYGIYLLFLGLPQLMRSPRDKAVGYTAAVVICTILLGVALAVLSTVTGGFGGYGRFGGMPQASLSSEARQQQAAAAVGSMLGAALNTDEKGKQGLSAALNNLAQVGQKMDAAEKMEAAQKAEAAQNAAGTSTADAGTAAANVPAAAAATAGLLAALGGAMGGPNRVDPVDFHELKAMLPESLPGMQRVGAEGNSQQAMGVKASSATANYKGPAGAGAQIKIADVSGVSGLLDVAGALASSPDSESDTGYEKNTTVGGRPAHEKYDGRSKHGEVSLIVAKRFAVDISGDSVPMSTLEQYAGGIDYARLEAMKGQGAQPR